MKSWHAYQGGDTASEALGALGTQPAIVELSLLTTSTVALGVRKFLSR